MSLVATLICNPNSPALDSTAIEGARAVLPQPNAARWLHDEVAADIVFDSDEDALAIAERLRAARGD
ncbi:phosphoserine phosphatase, partial [Rhodopseudomonas sp. AAP120]